MSEKSKLQCDSIKHEDLIANGAEQFPTACLDFFVSFFYQEKNEKII